MGILKKAASGVLTILPCSRTRVRSARQNGCGLAGRTFLNIPPTNDIQLISGFYLQWERDIQQSHYTELRKFSQTKDSSWAC
jgi:hypothetical protein